MAPACWWRGDSGNWGSTHADTGRSAGVSHSYKTAPSKPPRAILTIHVSSTDLTLEPPLGINGSSQCEPETGWWRQDEPCTGIRTEQERV